MSSFESIKIGNRQGYKAVSAVYSPQGEDYLVAFVAPDIHDLEKAWNRLTAKKCPDLDFSKVQKILILGDNTNDE